MGVSLDCLSEAQAVDQLAKRIDDGVGAFVVTANLDHLRRCRRYPDYRQLVSEADVVVADGMPLIWASRLQGGNQLPERVAGSTMMFSLCQRAADDGHSIFLLGGYPEEVAEQAGEALKGKYPGLKIAGTFCPPFGFEQDDAQMEQIRQMLKDAQPDIVYVALGSPKQEYLSQALRAVLPQSVWIGIGISLSFATGDVQRAPAILQKIGLEWVHRLVQEPKRLFRRYIIDGLPFAAMMGTNAFFARLLRKDTRYDR